MERLFLECAVRAALLVAGIAMVLYVMRVKTAAAKHSIWSAVVLAMLVLPIYSTWGPKASLRVLPPVARMTAAEAIAPAGSLAIGFIPSPLISLRKAVLLGVYLFGLCLFLFRLGLGTLRARRLVHEAAPHEDMRTSPMCTAPMTVGFLHPVVIFPEDWREWPEGQLEAVVTHEGEHARRRDPLVQWLALLNRALFWFHPAAWWLERHLSALAEEACDNAVLARGHNPHEYAECLMEMARSVARSGVRLRVAGMAMPGSSLPRRIRQIMEGGQVPRISRARMACVGVACAMTCTAFAAGTLDHAQQPPSAPPAPAASPATKFVLGDIKIEGDVHDRDGVRDRILKAWKDRECDSAKDVVDFVMELGVRLDFQDRGYFKVVAHDPVSQSLGIANGKERILIIASVTEGNQYRLGTFTIQNAAPDRALSIPAADLRDLFHLRNGDLFNVDEIRGGLERTKSLYDAKGYAGAAIEPATAIDDAHHLIDFTLRITEGPRTK
jgi:beta-lactamase regulating signal transducer with metallopeptidase domain